MFTLKNTSLCYKIFKVANNNLYSPYIYTDWGCIKDKKTLIIQSNRQTTNLLKDESSGLINNGIHVFTNRTDAEEEFEVMSKVNLNEIFMHSLKNQSYTLHIFPVKCMEKDFIEKGWGGLIRQCPSSVFMEVEVILL